MTLYTIYYSEWGEDKCELVAADHEPTELEAVAYLATIFDDMDVSTEDIKGIYRAVAYTLDGKDVTITATEALELLEKIQEANK